MLITAVDVVKSARVVNSVAMEHVTVVVLLLSVRVVSCVALVSV